MITDRDDDTNLEMELLDAVQGVLDRLGLTAELDIEIDEPMPYEQGQDIRVYLYKVRR